MTTMIAAVLGKQKTQQVRQVEMQNQDLHREVQALRDKLRSTRRQLIAANSERAFLKRQMQGQVR
jgi:outer membrane murein-binding lipoprotein Lpp